MKCSHAVSLFDEYLKQTISPSEKQQLSEHLKECAACQKQWETYRFFFENSAIEEDFLVPSALNAKIKYTIHEAKNNKKVPFYQNKQLLAGLTACSFLLVGTLWGTSYYQQIKEAKTQPDTGIAEPMVRTMEPPVQQSGEETLSQEIMADTNQAPEAKQKPELASQSPAMAKNTPVDTVLETAEDPPAYSPDETDTTPSRAMMITESIPVKDELKISEKFQEAILSTFPNEVLTEDTYLVTVTKEELEELLGCSVDADETKTQLTIQFVKLSD